MSSGFEKVSSYSVEILFFMLKQKTVVVKNLNFTPKHIYITTFLNLSETSTLLKFLDVDQLNGI